MDVFLLMCPMTLTLFENTQQMPMTKSKEVVVIVGNSNVFIEEQEFSAKEKGCESPSGQREAQDPSWRIGFGKLLWEVASKRVVEHAILVGSRPPQNDQVWKMAEDSGSEVTVHDRSPAGTEKAVDTELVAQGTEVICTSDNVMDLAILSGDRDFLPLVKMAQKHKWQVEMWVFKSSFN